MTTLEKNRFYTDETDLPIVINANGSEISVMLTEKGTIKIICNENNKSLLVKPSTSNSVELIVQ